MYLISCYFEEKAKKRIQSWINEISDCTGNTFMTEHLVPPHITISAFEAREDEQAVKALDAIAGQMGPFEVQIVSVGTFFPYVIFAQTILNQKLEETSEIVSLEVSKIPDVRMSNYYQKYSWIPHITLGKTLSQGQMQTAFSIMQQKFVPLKARIESIGVAKPNPHRDLKIIDFRNL